jgi:Sortilin, neurotensin receptor 3,
MTQRGRRPLLIALVLVAVAALATFAVAARGPALRDHDARQEVAAEEGGHEENGAEENGAEENEAEEDEGNDFFLDSRTAPNGGIASGDLQAAANQADAIRAATLKELPGLLNPKWSLVGPSNVGGRVTDIAPDPTQSGRVFVAVATAGVWKSEDGGRTLTQTWPNDFPQAVGAVTVDQNGTVYVGTGEVNPGGGSLSYGGDGVYRSTDHGATWQRLPLGSGVTTIGAIRVDPTDSKRIFVAAGGSLFSPGGVRGVYRSTDGGATWTRVLAGLNDFTGATDLIMDPSNPNKLFAPMWDHHREPLCRCYAGIGTGLYLSTNGGDSWTRLENDRITSFTPGDTIGFSQNADLQARIGVAIAPSNPNRVYVTLGSWSQTSTAQRSFRGFYRSDDGGATFTTMANANPGGDTVWTSKIWVDPANPDRLFIAGINLRVSADGGATWASVPGVHADHHAMAWDPTTSGAAARAYEGNDGGFYNSADNGTSFTEAANEPWTQFYTLDVGEQNPERVVGGAQDNGCLRSWDSTGAVTGNWGSYGGCGDGEYTVIDYTDQNFVYGCSQFGSCRRSSNAGNTSSTIGATTADRRNWETPIVLDPNDPSVMYYGGNILNRTANVKPATGAPVWTPISPSLSNPASGTDPAYPFGTITTVAIAKTDPKVIYAGTDDGWLWGTTDGGANWTRFTDPALPNRWVTRVAVDPTNAKVVYVTYSGYRNADNNAHILRSSDGGAHWVDISGNLPGAPTQDVIVDPTNVNRVFVASDVGVFTANVAKSRNKAEGAAITWRQLGSGLPAAPVNDLRYHQPSNTLYAATYGRSIWKLQIDRDDLGS